MNLRKVLRKSPLARQIYFRTWVGRYLAAKLSKRRSFAQAGEDLKIDELIGTVRWFVDIGANDGISGSNTFYFALRGAHGICFEPVSETYTKLRWLYLLNPRVRTVQCGISDKSRTAEIVAADFLSSLPETEDKEHVSEGTKDIDERHKEEITLLRFEEAVKGLNLPSQCDLLSIDVEGHEQNVLMSIPFERYTFRAIVIETHLFDSNNNRCKWRHRDLVVIEKMLSDHGYQPTHRTWLNTIYTRN